MSCESWRHLGFSTRCFGGRGGVSQKFSGRSERSQQVLGAVRTARRGLFRLASFYLATDPGRSSSKLTGKVDLTTGGDGCKARRGGPRLLRGSDGISGFSAQVDNPVLCRSHPSPSLLAVSPSPSLPSTPPTETPPLGRFNDGEGEGEKSAGREGRARERRKDRKKERARVMCTVAASVPNAFYTFHINYCGRSVCQGRSWSALESQAPPFFVNMRKNKIKNITSKH